MLNKGGPADGLHAGQLHIARFLHVGSGKKRKYQTLKAFGTAEWQEVRLDIDAGVKPDIVDKLPELAEVKSDSFDAVYSSHCLEHLYPHEVPVALSAFYRVLNSDGIAVVRCPDLQVLGELLASGEIDKPLYVSGMGPVTPLDMLYGFRPSIASGNLYMAHHTGFTAKTIVAAFKETGFRGILCLRMEATRELWVIATKAAVTREEMAELAKIYIAPV